MSKYLKKNRGFTLIELLIVIGILAILATTVVMVINPAEMVKQSRDGNRMAELQSINKALLVYQSFGGSSSMGTYNIIYISLSDSDSQCGSYYGTLSATSTGWNYHCSPEADYRKTDGNGWIPVDLTSVESSSGALFASLPIDPTNTATGQLYYTYIPGSWALSTTLESTKYLAANATSDGGQNSSRFEVGNELVLNSNLVWNCGSTLTDSRDSKEYTTVEIGTQCWMSENINVGTMTAGVNEQGTSCSSIQKYCYSDTESNCTSGGGFYQWNQAMCGLTNEGSQGICPSGWHIPTDAEWCTLENEVDSGSVSCSATGYRGIDVGGGLKEVGTTHWNSPNEGATNSSGFTALAVGWRNTTGSFSSLIINTDIWTSTESSTSAFLRALHYTEARVLRTAYSKSYGFSVRCIKD
jgi:uncharacterized protein (TIGR02145 family)/prepilin-type N-terminal cleavage/methylation domain-containing protein